MKTDKQSQTIITTVLIIILLSICVFIKCNARQDRIPEDVIMAYQEKEWYEETLRAYNHLLHRIWIDRPNYVEDVLCETDEFWVLDSLMNGHWEDTFEFYNTQDSVDYHENWFREGYINPECVDTIPSLPQKIEKVLKNVFGKY